MAGLPTRTPPKVRWFNKDWLEAVRLLIVAAGLILGAAILFHDAPPTIRDRVATANGGPWDGRDLDVIVFGTSLTHRADWPGRIAGRPSPCGRGVITMTVHGLPGAGSREGLAEIQAASLAETDIAIVEYGMNDADLLDGISRGESRDNHRRIIAALRAKAPGIAIVLMATNPVSGLQQVKRPRLAAYYRDYAVLAEESDVSFFDGPARWASSGFGREALPDGLHPAPSAEADLYQDGMFAILTRIMEPACPEKI